MTNTVTRRGADPELHFNSGKPYTQEDDEYLLKYAGFETLRSLGMQMGRSPGSLSNRLQRLNAAKERKKSMYSGRKPRKAFELLPEVDELNKGINVVISKINSGKTDLATIAETSGYHPNTIIDFIRNGRSPRVNTFFDVMAAAGVKYKMEVQE